MPPNDKKKLDPRAAIDRANKLLKEPVEDEEDVPEKERVMTFMEMVAASYAPP